MNRPISLAGSALDRIGRKSMANFRTHLGVGTIVIGLLATLALAAAIVADNDILSVALAGVLGSILPDVDLQRSRPSRIIFFFLGLFFSFCALFAYSSKLSIVELWILWLGVFAGVRYFGQLLFHRFATHRGIFHSILAALFFFILTALVFTYILGKEPLVSWIAGLFVFIGYLVHLTLDELYSVDFEDNRIKRSFGTALKLFDYRNPLTSLTMTAVAALMLYVAPSLSDVYETIKERPVSTVIKERFLPQGTWFGLDRHLSNFADNARKLTRSPSQAAPLTQSAKKSEADDMPSGSIDTPQTSPPDTTAPNN